MSSIADKEVQHIIEMNPNLSALAAGTRTRMRRITVAVYPYIQKAVHDLCRLEKAPYGRDAYNRVILAAIVKQYIRHHGAASYASVEPIDMFKGADGYLQQIRRGKRFLR